MDEGTKILLVGMIVFITHTLEGITGFGCTVLALPFIAMLIGIKAAVPILAVLAWILAFYIILMSWKDIVWKEYLFILICVGMGLPVGILLFNFLPEIALKSVLAVLMTGVGIHGLAKHYSRTDNELPLNSVFAAKKSLLMRTILFLGGVTHGAFVSGGPFVVIYATKALPNKSLFRVSLCLLWLTVNTVWIVQFTLTNSPSWTPDIGKMLLGALPFLITGMIFGDYLHKYISERLFRLIVYGVLTFAGLILLSDVMKRSIFTV
jgi:uncharacterized membrane protein YfcA